jgi:DNA-binding transcriptional ArsR family regulator
MRPVVAYFVSSYAYDDCTMALPKTERFSDEFVALAGAMKALVHPARLAILETLAERGSCVCGELVAEIPLAQSTVSQHLKALRSAGLIRGEVDGPRACYCLDAGALASLQTSLTDLLGRLTRGAPDAPCC